MTDTNLTISTSDEIWKTIKGFEDYSVSSIGRVKRNVGTSSRWYAGRIIKTGYDRKGYPRVKIRANKKSHTKLIHKLVAMAFIGDCPEGLQVNHKNGTKTDNRPENLEYVTMLENIRHAYANGLMNTQLRSRIHGEKNFSAKVPDSDIPRIFELRQ